MTESSGTFLACAQPVFYALMTPEERDLRMPLSYRWDLYRTPIRKMTTAAHVSAAIRTRFWHDGLPINARNPLNRYLEPLPAVTQEVLHSFADVVGFSLRFSGQARMLNSGMADQLDMKYIRSELHGACDKMQKDMLKTTPKRDSALWDQTNITVVAIYQGALILRELEYVNQEIQRMGGLSDERVAQAQSFFKFFTAICAPENNPGGI